MNENFFATRHNRQAVESKRPQSDEAWKQKLEWFTKSLEYRELDCIDGEPLEFEWNILPGQATLQLLRKIQTTMEENRIQPEKFEDRIIFMSMYNDIDWRKAENKGTCISNSFEVKAYANRFPKGHWSFLGPGTEE